jgi:hypothetical protein
VGERKYIS